MYSYRVSKFVNIDFFIKYFEIAFRYMNSQIIVMYIMSDKKHTHSNLIYIQNSILNSQRLSLREILSWSLQHTRIQIERVK